MKIYIICPVRKVTAIQMQVMKDYVLVMEELENKVHFPPRDCDQKETEYVICETHRIAMEKCDEVHIFWSTDSKGSHFDLGMAFALGKKIKLIELFESANRLHKNYYDFIIQLEKLI